MIRRFSLPLAALVSACGAPGSWTMEVWGEPFIEQGIDASAFSDGCAIMFDHVYVVVSGRALRDDAGGEVAALGGAQVYDLVPPGPVTMGTAADVPGGTYRDVQVRIAPVADATAGNVTDEELAAVRAAGASVWVQGTLTCPSGTVRVDWPFTTSTTYDCEPTNLVVGAGADATSQLTVHGDHLFYDSLIDPDAELQGEAYVAADADGDGVLTVAELQAAPVAPTGLDVGAQADVTNVWQYLQAQSTTVGHIDGEGECLASR